MGLGRTLVRRHRRRSMPALHALCPWDAFIKRRRTTLPHVDYVRGLENPTECSVNIVRYMVKEGYSDDDIGKAIGGNALRILGRSWP